MRGKALRVSVKGRSLEAGARGLAFALLPTLLLGACGGPAASAPQQAFEAPASRAGADGWSEYVDAPTIDAAAARQLAPGDASPEAAVSHFYASRIRGDGRYREVLVAPPSSRLERGLAELDDWKFRRFRLVGVKERAPGSLWVRVWFEIEVGGKSDGGTDEVGLRQVDGRWRIESVPT